MTSPVSNILCRWRDSILIVAGEEGFEPPHHRTRTYCLTAWLLPKMYCSVTSLILVICDHFSSVGLARHSLGGGEATPQRNKKKMTPTRRIFLECMVARKPKNGKFRSVEG